MLLDLLGKMVAARPVANLEWNADWQPAFWRPVASSLLPPCALPPEIRPPFGIRFPTVSLMFSPTPRSLRSAASPWTVSTLAWHLAKAALLLAPAWGCSDEAAAPTAKSAESPASVSVMEVRRESWPATVRIQGSLFADEQAVVGAKVAGLVREIPAEIDLGKSVAPGAVLAWLDEVEFQLRVEEAQAQLAQARAKLGLDPSDPVAVPNRERAAPVVEAKALLDDARRQADLSKELVEVKLNTKEELDEKLAALQVADARYRSALNSADQQIAQLGVFASQLALARQQLLDATIKAPFAGTIQRRHVAPGAYVRVGDPVVTLHKIDPLRFRGGVPEREATQVREGQKVQLRITGLDYPVTSSVTRTSPTLDTNSRTLPIEVNVPNPAGKLRSGLFVQAEIIIDETAMALAVPESAVFDFAGVEKVWVISGDEAQERQVSTGRRQGDRIEILDGLKPGDWIAVDSAATRAGKVVARQSRQPEAGLSE